MKCILEFDLQLVSILVKSKLHIHYQVINISNQKMPFSIGAHPAFALAGDFEDYELEFEQEEHELKTYLLTDDLLSKNSEILN